MSLVFEDSYKRGLNNIPIDLEICAQIADVIFPSKVLVDICFYIPRNLEGLVCVKSWPPREMEK